MPADKLSQQHQAFFSTYRYSRQYFLIWKTTVAHQYHLQSEDLPLDDRCILANTSYPLLPVQGSRMEPGPF